MYYKDNVLVVDNSEDGMKQLISYLAVMALFPTKDRLTDIRMAGENLTYVFDRISCEIRQDTGSGSYSTVYSLSANIIKRKKELKDYINGYVPKSKILQ